MAYCTSADPLVLLVAANQPGFSAGNDHPLYDGVYYLTTLLSFARAYAYPSLHTLPLMALQGTHLLSHALVDAGYVAEDNGWLQFMQSATGLASEALGLIFHPDLPIKALQGISLLAQGLHCAELAWERISPYLPYTEVEEITGSNQTESAAAEELAEEQPAAIEN